MKLTLRENVFCLLLCIFSFFPTYTDAQNKSFSINEVREMVLTNKIADAIDGYSQLVAKDSLNPSLLSEYSYVLALGGAFDCALMNLDRIRLFSTNSVDGLFYTSLVFALMGHDDLSTGFLENIPVSKVPKWISPENHIRLMTKQETSIVLNSDKYQVAFKRVNYLSASGLYLQSIALSEEIIANYPKEYLPHVGYSIILEKLNLYPKAAQELDIAIKLMGDTPKEIEAKKVFEKRRKELADKINSPQNIKNKWSKYKNDFNPQTMLYVGGMVTESSVSFDSRFGLFLTNTFNGAIDLNLSGGSGDFNVNLGASGYQRFGVFVWGEGLSLQMGNSTVLNLKSSLGLSFINRKRNSSWDIFFEWYVPIGKDVKSSYGISIGKSIYFGKRK